MVPDLDRDNASGLKRFDLPLEIVRAGIYLLKFSHNFALRIENRR